MEAWGERVRRYRRLKRRRDGNPWTQEDLADASGIDRRYIGRIETGEVADPSAETVRKLAKALGVTMRQLAEPLGWYDDDKRPTVETMEEIDRAIRDDPDLDDEQKGGLILSARTLLTPYLEEARRRKKRPGERRPA
jgi:transcriptional regulator with XRE-family HTH domain